MKLNLDVFEGPLDLLLYLIRKNNLEISKISLTEITAQYLNYLEAAKELNVDLASDFLYMAAELTHLKSRALLPHDEMEQAQEDDEASRLVERLKVYQYFKTLAMRLEKRPLLYRDAFKKGTWNFVDKVSPEDKDPAQDSTLKSFDVNPYDLVKAFCEILKRLPKRTRDHHVTGERVSVMERIYEILDELKKADSLRFEELFRGSYDRSECIVTFLAILEMTKLGFLKVYQTEIFGPIRLQRKIENIETTEMQKGLEKEITYQ